MSLGVTPSVGEEDGKTTDSKEPDEEEEEEECEDEDEDWREEVEELEEGVPFKINLPEGVSETESCRA